MGSGLLVMRLREAIDRLPSLGDEISICARRPWTAEADCVATALVEPHLSVPPEVKAAGFEYFIDVPTAKEVLGVLRDPPPAAEEVVSLLIYYAEYDAYPDWVYSRDG